jgi:hypothetical protein
MYRFLSAFMLTGLLLATNVQASLEDSGIIELSNYNSTLPTRPQTEKPNYTTDAIKDATYIGLTYFEILEIASTNTLYVGDNHFFMELAQAFKTGYSGERYSLNIGYYKKFQDLAQVVVTYKFPTSTMLTEEAIRCLEYGYSLQDVCSRDLNDAVFRVMREAKTAYENYVRHLNMMFDPHHNVKREDVCKPNDTTDAVKDANYIAKTYIEVLEQASKSTLEDADHRFVMQVAQTFKTGYSGEQYAFKIDACNRFCALVDQLLAYKFPDNTTLRDGEPKYGFTLQEVCFRDLTDAIYRVKREANRAKENDVQILCHNFRQFTIVLNPK